MPITQEKLNSWYEHKSNKEKVIEAEEEKEFDCEDCQDTGEIDCMGYVYPGEPHQAMIDSRPCHCRSRGNEEVEED